MIQFNSLVKIAVAEAEKSTYKQKIGCVIYNKNRIISRAYNVVNRYCKKVKTIYKRWPSSLHAEVNAILKAKTDLKGCSILIVRISGTEDKYLLSKPCGHCASYMDYVGIKSIMYSTSESPYWEVIDL